MNTIILSKNYSKYKSGYYHNDIVKGWKKTTNCFVYGPGYPGYNNDDDIDSVIEKSPFKKEDLDIIVFSTSWDDDESDDNVDPHCNIRLEKIDSVKKIYYLNKEYKKLELRFDYAKLQSVDLIVTVHPNFKLWEEEVGIRFVQSHFAVDLARFGYNNEPKDYDFGFTGGLHMKHLDFRSKVKNEIFLDKYKNLKSNYDRKVILRKSFFKEKYLGYNIYWAEFGAKNLLGQSLLPHGNKYAKFLRRFKSFLNTPSAIGIFNTRFFELMASRTLIICPKVDSYNGIMKDGDNCLMFKEDMSDFSLVLEKAQDENVRLPIINNAQKFVRQHTYEARAKKIIEVIQGTESDSKQ